MRWEGFEIPDNCLVRLLDLDPSVRGLTVIDDTGFANIYINARLSYDGQREALKHELRHYFREDMTSEADIRTVEAAADRPSAARVTALDGTPLDLALPEGLRPVGRGVYRPEGDALTRALADLNRVEALLRRALRIYDVMQPPPFIPLDRLERLVSGLCAEDIAFVGFPPTRPSPVMQLCREAGDTLRGVVYYDDHGRPDNALLLLALEAERLTVDLRRRRGTLDVYAISREWEGGCVRVWG